MYERFVSILILSITYNQVVDAKEYFLLFGKLKDELVLVRMNYGYLKRCISSVGNKDGVDGMLDLQPVIDDLLAFREEREWLQFHNPKDLAISISLEAAELLEAFQWSGSDTTGAGKEDKIREELADVMIYCLYMADAMDVNPVKIIEEKVRINREKYPAAAARGNARKYTEL